MLCLSVVGLAIGLGTGLLCVIVIGLLPGLGLAPPLPPPPPPPPLWLAYWTVVAVPACDIVALRLLIGAPPPIPAKLVCRIVLARCRLLVLLLVVGPLKIVVVVPPPPPPPPPLRFTFRAMLFEPTRVVLNSWPVGVVAPEPNVAVVGPFVKMMLCDGDCEGLCRSRIVGEAAALDG